MDKGKGRFNESSMRLLQKVLAQCDFFNYGVLRMSHVQKIQTLRTLPCKHNDSRAASFHVQSKAALNGA